MITFSPSSISVFNTCPKQYEAKHILKNVQFIQTDATRYGTRLHEAIERRIKNVAPLPTEFAWLEPLCITTLAMTGEKLAEKALAILADGSACDYYDKAAWVRCIGDLLVYDHERKSLTVIDWKTGKPKTDTLQLKITALCGAALYPDVEKIKVAFVYTKTGAIDSETYTCNDLSSIMLDVQHAVLGVAAAHDSGVFMPTPSGLCKAHCPVSDCAFHGVGRRRY